MLTCVVPVRVSPVPAAETVEVTGMTARIPDA
jgi:hypothetical protein